MSEMLIDQIGRQAPRADVARGIVAAAILLFVTFAAEAVPSAVAALRGGSGAPDGVLAAALLINVAVLLFCLRTPAVQLRTVRN